MTTTDEVVITQLAAANPVPQSAAPTAEERAEAERVLQRVLDDESGRPGGHRRPGRHRRSGILAWAVSLVVVVAVAAVVLSTGGSSTTGSQGKGDVRITLRAQPTPQTPRITRAAMSREMALLRRRLASLGHGFTVRQSGTASIVVTAPKRAERGQIVPLLTPSAQLRFSDWEANVLTPNGKTVASQLLTQDHTAVLVSQGAGEGPGFAGAGSRPLYEAATLGAAQPRSGASRFLSRLGPEYYLFGRPGSRACAAVAAAHGSTPPIPSTHCLLAGPLDPGSSVSRARAIGELAAQLPAGVASSQGQVVVVPQGTLIVKAQPLHSLAPEFSSPGAQFFVMRDRVALTGSDITHPRASTDAGGAPSVTFNFTRTGRAAFQQATRAIAHRGAHVSLGGETLDQHFAVALDNQLVTVPSIDFRQYPDGVPGANGADITGGLTPATARDMATQLRYGALPLALRVTQIH